jgi:hypothetical protein
MKTLFDADCYTDGTFTYKIEDGVAYQWFRFSERWVVISKNPGAIDFVSRLSSCEVPDELRSKLEAS